MIRKSIAILILLSSFAAGPLLARGAERSFTEGIERYKELLKSGAGRKRVFPGRQAKPAVQQSSIQLGRGPFPPKTLCGRSQGLLQGPRLGQRVCEQEG